jgi:deoxyribodipyrimidine photo-lyase
MRVLVWFRSDLRRADNVALADACISGDDGVVGLFLTAPGQWRRSGWGAPRVDFVLRNVAALSERLTAWSIPLLVRPADSYDDAPAAVVAAALDAGCGEVIYNREHGVDEVERDRRVEEACRDAGLRFTSYNERAVVPPGSLATKGKGTPYAVYTPFRRAWGSWLDAHGWPTPTGDPRRPRPVPGVEADPVPASLPGFDTPDCATYWPAGELEALRRLNEFKTRRAAGYHTERDRYDHDGTSSLSPYLACGAIAAARCVAEIRPLAERPSASRDGAEVWLDQLVWREFYLHVMEGFPHVARGEPFRDTARDFPWLDDDEGFQCWCDGRTGYPVVDAAMRQLAATGWMHNRLRMISAMFLTKDLLVDWRRGEAFFMERLVDADFANNNGGWQWVAGTGTDATPFHRMFNPETQSRRFDPRGDFLREWLPELEPLDANEIHAPWSVPGARLADSGYPRRVVRHPEARARYLEAVRGGRPPA